MTAGVLSEPLGFRGKSLLFFAVGWFAPVDKDKIEDKDFYATQKPYSKFWFPRIASAHCLQLAYRKDHWWNKKTELIYDLKPLAATGILFKDIGVPEIGEPLSDELQIAEAKTFRRVPPLSMLSPNGGASADAGVHSHLRWLVTIRYTLRAAAGALALRRCHSASFIVPFSPSATSLLGSCAPKQKVPWNIQIGTSGMREGSHRVLVIPPTPEFSNRVVFCEVQVLNIKNANQFTLAELRSILETGGGGLLGHLAAWREWIRQSYPIELLSALFWGYRVGKNASPLERRCGQNDEESAFFDGVDEMPFSDEMQECIQKAEAQATTEYTERRSGDASP